MKGYYYLFLGAWALGVTGAGQAAAEVLKVPFDEYHPFTLVEGELWKNQPKKVSSCRW